MKLNTAKFRRKVASNPIVKTTVVKPAENSVNNSSKTLDNSVMKIWRLKQVQNL